MASRLSRVPLLLWLPLGELWAVWIPTAAKQPGWGPPGAGTNPSALRVPQEAGQDDLGKAEIWRKKTSLVVGCFVFTFAFLAN